MVLAVSLLRGINVGGHNKIRMADLRALYASLGFGEARTLLQSGNVVFETSEGDLTLVGRQIEAGIRRDFGHDIRVIMRSSADFETIFSRHRFSAEQLLETKKLVIVFLSGEAAPAAVDDLRSKNPGREVIHADGSELFVFYRDGQARSKLDNSRIERALGLQSTARNWNSCNKLLKLFAEFDA
ncbi:MAG: DUF1697 domain-containing protein [Chloroflexota bacterium]|nr:DUF1697 domain-containing protein [Chloroflexota bacterium]MDE2947902.1 DUF1697 domain-containing protein [Chloroflexota bacterium]